MSIVRYNGVTLPYGETSSFRQEVMYDDVGGVDWYCTKFDIRVNCVVNAAYLEMIYPDLVDNDGTPLTRNPADIMAAVRTTLLQPRRTLSFTFNGVELIPEAQGSNSGTVDAQNGPKPQSCVIEQLTNTTFFLTFHVIAHYWENNSVNPETDPIVQNFRGNNVLFNRWTETVEIDDRGFNRRIRDGKFVIRSDNVNGRIADQIRSQMAVVGVPNGFLRESANYTQSPDGLAILYRIVDREVYVMPPQPAFKADGEYIETSTNGGVLRHCEVWVHLEGAKNTDQKRLITQALTICKLKFNLNGINLGQQPAQPANYLLEHTGVRVKMYDNVIDVRMRALAMPSLTQDGQGRVQGQWGLNLQGMTTTPLSPQGTPPPPYLDRGTGSVLLQAAAYYDPSLVGTQINKEAGQLNAGLLVGEAGLAVEGE